MRWSPTSTCHRPSDPTPTWHGPRGRPCRPHRWAPREQAHHDAFGAWAAGRWHQAAQILDDLLVRWPADLLALQQGHGLDFFVGDAANLRDRPRRSLSALDPAYPHTGFVRGMQAFGLEESATTRPPRTPGRPRSRPTPTTCGPSTPSPTPARCGGWSTPAPASSPSAKPTGAAATCSPCTTGGTSPCSTWRRATWPPPWPSTTARSTTSRPTALP